MPPPIDQQKLDEARSSVRTLDREIDALARELLALQERRAQAERSAAPAAALREIAAAERALLTAQRERLRAREERLREIGGIVADLDVIVAADPNRTLDALETKYPVALLPVRIETRFIGQRLHVRLYPDQIHVDQHDEAITEEEAEIGRRYWRAVWANATAAEDAWREAALGSTPERAAYLVDRLRPTNLARRGADAEPAFPAIETVPLRSPVRAVARLLPKRWLVVLYGARGVELCRKWAPKLVPDELVISPFGELFAQPPEESDGELPIDEAARWLVDFARAVEVGMALTIEESELIGGAKFSGGITRLVAVGVDWTRTPTAAAEALAEQLAAHGYSDGFELLAHGEPTNNTASRASHYRSRERDRTALFPAEPPAVAPADGDAAKLAAALGTDAAATFARFPGGDRRYDATARAVQTALWGAAFGFYFTEVLAPLLSPSTIRSLRRHLEQHVRPAGPLPPLRIGRQPYGVLPMLSTPLRFAATDRLERIAPEFERYLATSLMRIREWVEHPVLQGISEDTLAKIATMTNVPSGRTPEDVLAEILKLGPVGTRAEVRVTAGRATRENTVKSAEAAANAHREIVRLVLANLGVRNHGIMVQIAPGDTIKLLDLVVQKTPRYVLNDIPWVGADADAVRKAVAKARAAIEAAVRDPNLVGTLLAISAGAADTLLEGLLLLSAAFEYTHAAEEELRLPIYEAQIEGTRLPELVGIEKPTAEPGKATIATPRQMLQIEAAANRTLLAEVHAKILQAGNQQLPDAKAFHAALATLEERPREEVDHALRGTLDLGSHRLDAWITSVATRRLAALRASAPKGIHIGGYGFVHDLKPDTAPDSEGYVHVPSADHAVTAAVLRSGHAANRADNPEAFAIRLTSERVRNALYISEGLAQGQRTGALLGYRFERWLIDGRLQAKYINAFRKIAPQPEHATTPSGPQESIAARDVVDGQRLAELWRDKRTALFTDLAAAMPQPFPSVPAEDRGPLTAALDRLVDLFDSFLDLWTTESVHQLARGNRDRAAAALAVIDRQERPPEPLAVQTPRQCWGYLQRVLWVLPAAATAPGWPSDLVARTEPGANALAARLLGPAERFVLSAHFVTEDGTPVGAPLSMKLTELGLSPLSLLLLSQPTGRDQPTRLEERIAAAFTTAAETVPPGTGVVLDRDPPPGAPEGAVGGGDLLALLEAVRGALFDRRALSQQTFLPPQGLVAQRAAVDTVVARAEALLAEMEACIAQLDAALPENHAPNRTALKSALERAATIVPVPFWMLTPAFSSVSDEDLAADGGAVRANLAKLLSRARAVQPVEPTATPGDGDELRDEHLREAQMQAAAERIRVVFGPAFPVLPPFTLGGEVASEWTASLEDQQALHGSAGKLAVPQFLRTASFVRDGVRALVDALDAAALTRHPGAREDARVVQLPHVKGRKWAALPFDDEPPVDVRMSAIVFGELATGDEPMIGVLLDEWTEAIPERTTKTSVSFQYDAPGARPPQTILLAVDAGVDGPAWTPDALIATVNEMFDLARLRLLTPPQIAGHGAMLPTVFIPQNLSSEVPSWDLLSTIRATTAATANIARVLGKS